MNNLKKIYALLFSLLLIFSVDASEKMVEGIGVASGASQASHEEALQKALRNAVEKAVGVFVSSESLVKDFQLIEDNIYSNVQGYVKDYEILEDNKGQDGITRIKIKASVKEANLESDLQGIKIILKAKGNPKTMINLSESLDGEDISLIALDIENYFSKKSFPLIDKKQFDQIKAKDDLESDSFKSQALATRIGAELMIVGKASAKVSSEREAYGVPVFTCMTSLNIKAVNTDTGAVLATLNSSETAHGGSPSEAAKDALKKSWTDGSDLFFKNIMEKFRSSILNESDITLIIANCSPKERVIIKKKLQKVTGINSVYEKSFKNNVCEFQIMVGGVYLKTIDEKISELIPELLLTAKTQNRLDFEVSINN